MAKVFISYARKDKDEVYPIVDMLEKNGIDCWIDKDGIESGDEFKKVIITAINECNAFIYMLSDNAVESEWVGKEYGHAKRKEKRIIPVFLKGATQNDEIMFDWDQIDYVDTEKEGWQKKLLKSVKKICDNNTNLTIKNESQHVSSENNTKTTVEDSHEYVDLGLPSGLLWATCNVGATKPEETGDFFAWGETKTKKYYKIGNCDTLGKERSFLESQNIVSSKGILSPKYDAATQNMGNNWRMPTKEDFEELLEYCVWIETTQNYENGYMITSKANSRSIFLPMSGYMSQDSITHNHFSGFYWCSSIEESSACASHSLYIDNYNMVVTGDSRSAGYQIRAVKSKF